MPAKKKVSNARAKGPKTSGNNGKKSQVEDISSQPKEVKEPFALVLYNDSTKGVVETKSIAKKFRIIGSTCKAPNPIDWVEGQVRSTAKETEAKVIVFGRKLHTSV